MITVECPICKRTISTRIDEAKTELEVFVCTQEFVQDAINHLRKHTVEEITDWFWKSLVQQVKEKHPTWKAEKK